MVKENDPWKKAYREKLEADEQWERALESKNPEYIKSAMELSNLADRKLLYEEQKIRAEKINKIPVDWDSTENQVLEARRQAFIEAFLNAHPEHADKFKEDLRI